MFELEEKLIAVLNDSQLPLDAKFYVIQSIENKLLRAYEDAKKRESEVKAHEQVPQ